MFSSVVGSIHFVASVIALISGTIVLCGMKGTKIHKKVGYIYAVSMLVVVSTSFMIYRLHGRFGILHWFSVVSSLSLLGGMLPMLLKKPKNYMAYHFSFMYWSVIGLYCAFCAEIFTRIPIWLVLDKNVAVLFYAMVGVSTAVVGGIGSIYFRKYKHTWKTFDKHTY
ncbi:DUF2306 domain-containing protein [uncultured Dokdonia sp.]|uniref:DUF2306 domain-containing protein n=1 Tax=uncultured Dokdonia sp. TaxID=575653 RepID=UPI002618D20F|nr:DUF2306 domain-containing protein [uncultured Dokdonia sp.]